MLNSKEIDLLETAREIIVRVAAGLQRTDRIPAYDPTRGIDQSKARRSFEAMLAAKTKLETAIIKGREALDENPAIVQLKPEERAALSAAGFRIR